MESWDLAKRRKYRLGIVVAAAGLLAAGGLLYSRLSWPRRVLHCSATQARPCGLKAWEDVTAPVEIPLELEEALFDKCKVSSDDTKFLITHPGKNTSDNVFAYELSETVPGEALDIGGGTLKLCALGTAYLDSTQTIEDSAEYSFYDAHLRSISKEQAKKLRNYRLTQSGDTFRHDPFPAVQFGFEHEGIEDLMFHGIRVFDASTKMILSSGYSSSGAGKNRHWFKTEIAMWHRAPFDIALDVSYGPSRTFEFAPRAGEGFKVEGTLECRLVGVLEGIDTGWSSSSGNDNTYTLKFRKAESGKGGLRFIFLCQPKAGEMPVSFEFLDADRKKLSTSGGSTSGNIRCINIKQPLEKIALIRARYRTRRQRILVHVPYVPGLPEENNSIDNLFDVRIPYIRFRDIGRFTSFLEQTLQLKNLTQTGPSPTDSIHSAPFPLEFTGKTVREIAQVYATKGVWEVEIENDTLNLRYPIPLSMRLKEFWRRILRK